MIKIDIKKDLHGSNGLMKLEINLEIKEGEFLAISGLSGSGKTTLLRILAGLEEAEGFISVNNEIWLDKEFKLKVQKRGIGFVFQDYALFSNMSILENLLYVKKDKDLANKLLSMTRLKELEHRMPITLSGGQKQRVALCRALMSKPKLLLLDEPLSALDYKMREKLQKDILSFHKEFNLTTIMVSHDVSEIYKLSSKLIVLENGRIINEGNAKDILLKTQGSQKFSFEGEILEIKKVDVIYIAVISISQQLVEVVITKEEASILKVSQKITLGTKAFSPTIK
ncbi:MAG: ATP-binding cassette domain-containing protein [Campylobacteraceae bacterium]|nr:ATP-binding cassette domain-containing protein [Campylobacteraceae bacterium]